MQITPSAIPDVLLIEPTVFADARGYFFESFHQARWQAASGTDVPFVQDNHSRSVRGVVRGLHYQIQRTQGRLVRVVHGAVFDVAVDIRRTSPTFGRWIGYELSAENHRMVWIPPGFAHGFLVLSKCADFLYKATDYWAPEFERTILWNDPDLQIAWPATEAPIISARDRDGKRFRDAELFP
ncbi:MAG: dTDP-4-dehydrorhamnose 3,5-epimerase [Pirellulaceae bacterium]